MVARSATGLIAKQYIKEQADFSEHSFEVFCNKNRTEFVRLDKNKEAQEKFLKNSLGKSPDFLCKKDDRCIFIEVKTHTLLTNKARSEAMYRTVQAKKAAGLSGTTIFEPFDPRLELKGVFDGYLRSASGKFKNIKDGYNIPGVLLLSGSFIEGIDITALFWGAYPSFKRGGEYAGLKKEHSGLFDSTGSSVSAVVYWATDLKRYEGIANLRARTPLSEKDFKEFFETSSE